jgi:hypothetical protein
LVLNVRQFGPVQVVPASAVIEGGNHGPGFFHGLVIEQDRHIGRLPAWELHAFAAFIQRDGHFLFFPAARPAELTLFFTFRCALDDDDLPIIQLDFFRPFEVDCIACCQHADKDYGHPFAGLAGAWARRFACLLQSFRDLPFQRVEILILESHCDAPVSRS